MNRFTIKERIALAVSLSLILAFGLTGLSIKETEHPCAVAASHKRDSLRVAISLPVDNSKLLPGYNYLLAGKMAEAAGVKAKITFMPYSDTATTVLSGNGTDILVLPLEDSVKAVGRLSFIIADSVCIWMSANRHIIKDAGHFLDEFRKSDKYERTRFSFMNAYNPFRSRRRTALCPYDSLLRKQADSIGMDWRLLAAVAYQESRFRIEARSHMGAQGLMQLMPETAHRFGAKDLTDPAQSINAAGRYLKYLYRLSSDAETEEDRINMMLAAYNAGEGSLDEYQGADTASYAANVRSLYTEFCRIYPER